jgi:hypothetical protein
MFERERDRDEESLRPKVVHFVELLNGVIRDGDRLVLIIFLGLHGKNIKEGITSHCKTTIEATDVEGADWWTELCEGNDAIVLDDVTSCQR